ncbi:amino acid transporter [Karstenula rhodostoma CBS 690.94]|uniref:Amino acid transporter n=1 Tax=Karstenula rhodostoma CBS 690.94 TaxID=1392251 RepID=A0A9P4PES4_9PLEO|nr:amino acid transporter [Karstenula rhodostoma CBS 690.94]
MEEVRPIPAMVNPLLGNFDEEDLVDLEVNHERIRKEYTPSRHEKLRSFTVMCLIFNRSIGSGIFATPAKILRATNSVGVNTVFWAIGGFLTICGILVWLEFGLSIPREHVDGKDHAVPRSGGEKNYLEWVLRRPKFLATCMYGIAFVILGNLSGNAIAFGRYVLLAAGHEDPGTGPVIGLAIGALTVVALLHAISRRGGIVVNNCFAILKIGILLTIIILGFTVRGGKNFNSEAPRPNGSSLSPGDTFSDTSGALASYTTAFLYVMYTYSGFEQPFYVLSEVHRPRKYFARAVISALLILTVLFLLVNIAYVCVIPLEMIMDSQNASVDITSMFFEQVFGSNAAKHVVQALVAFSILGNLIVMTFTATRVKQEIAKEGILPKSLRLATSRTTPTAKLLNKITKNKKKDVEAVSADEHLEQSPMAALGLHWVSSVFLIAVTSGLNVDDSYNFLISLYAYVIISLMGFFTSLGLLYAKYVRKDFLSQKPPLGGPTAPIIYCVCNAFFLITAFLNPPNHQARTVSVMANYVMPAIGLSSILWGVIWWLGLQFVMKQRGQRLVVTRTPYCEKVDEKGEWVLKYEIIDHVWRADSDTGSVKMMQRRGE